MDMGQLLLVLFLVGALVGFMIAAFLALRKPGQRDPRKLTIALGAGLLAGGSLGWIIWFLLGLLFGSGAGSGEQLIVSSPTPTICTTSTPSVTPGGEIATKDNLEPCPTATPTLTPTGHQPPPSLTPTAKEGSPTPTPTRLTDTPTPTSTTPALPSNFSMLISGVNETACSFDDFEYLYELSIQADTISLTQVINGIVTSGPFDPATGAFSTTLSGLPGTELYSGIFTYDESSVKVTGKYTYYGDPNYCEGLWEIFGKSTP